ncbi:MAG TPA: hypothetical protein VGO59_09715 [Verrucomicrobiae bacterium]|jgi:hypothetical protein
MSRLQMGVAVLFLLALAGIAALLIQMARGASVRQSQMLGSLQPGQQTFSFRCPKGSHFSLVVAVPSDGRNPSLKVSGALSLKTDSKPPSNLNFDMEGSGEGQWLASSNLDGRGITLRDGKDPVHLDNYLSNGAPVEVHLDLHANLASGSLWLCYVTKWKDLKQQ